MNFKSLYLGSNTSLLMKIETITINMLLSMRNKFLYSCSIKIHTLGFSRLLESIFCLLMVMEVFSLQKVVEMLKEVVVGWGEVRWIWWMRQNVIALFVQLLKRWLCNMWLDIVVEKTWALSVDHCQLQALQFSVHLTNLLNILLWYIGFARDSESCSGSHGQQTTSDHCFFLVQVWL